MTTIIRANINEALEAAEDPEVMLNQILRDMWDGIKEAREQVVEAVAQQKLLERDFAQAQDLSDKWRQAAERAVAQGNEQLARESLRRKLDYDANAGTLRNMIEGQRPMLERLKGDLALLESRYGELQSQRESLIARYRVAKAQERVQTTTERVSSGYSVYDPASQLQDMERRIREKEARVAARAEMAEGARPRIEVLGGSSADPEVEAELLALKAAAQGKQLGSGEAPPR